MADVVNPDISFNSTGLPPDYCFTTFPRLNLDIVAAMSGFLTGTFKGIISSDSTPSIANRDKIWFKLNVGGSPTGKYFQYYGGFWVMPNNIPANAPIRIILECTESEVWSYDGGDGTDPALSAPTGTTGAMWTVDTNYAARMAIGAGTLSPSTTVLAVGDNAGADQATLLEVNIPEHRHAIQCSATGKAGDSLRNPASPDAPNLATTTQQTDYWGGDGATAGSKTTTPANILNPVRAALFCKRTSREFYTG